MTKADIVGKIQAGTGMAKKDSGSLETMLREIFEHRMPFNEVIGLKIESLDPESPRLAFDMRPDLVGNPLHNRLHGGVIAATLDTVGGLAVAVAIAEKHADESPEQIISRFGRCSTIDLRVDYLHQGIGSSFHAGARVVRLGGRIATVQMELKNEAGLLIANGTAAYIVS